MKVFIRFHQNCFSLLLHVHGEKKQIETQTKQKNMHPKPNCIAAILISRLLLCSPSVFAAMRKPKTVIKKAMRSTSAKGKPNSGKGKQALAKGKNTSAKRKPTSAKGKPFKNRAFQKGILKNATCKSWGSCPFKTKSKNRRKQ